MWCKLRVQKLVVNILSCILRLRDLIALIWRVGILLLILILLIRHRIRRIIRALAWNLTHAMTILLSLIIHGIRNHLI